MKFKFLALTLLLISLPLMGFGCKFSSSDEVKQLYKPIKLTWWGVWEDSVDVNELIKTYQAIHPNIKITYRKFRYEEYENELTRAWLEKRGPDIFSIPATHIRKYQALIKPMPEKMKLPFLELKGLKKEEVIVVKTVYGLTPKKVQELFVDTVARQVVINNEIYGLPLSLDTLALYYNRDLLNNAKIPLPAVTWAELINHVSKLTIFDSNNNIKQAAIALGTHDNIPRATDILSLLMMQNGAQMTDENNYVTFNQSPPEQPKFYPGKDALEFYTDFSNPTKEVYTWTEDMPDALEMFTSGKLAYFIGYSYQTPIIRAMSPKLNFNIVPMLQTVPDIQEINMADFWVLSTFFGTAEANIAPAWDFIKYITADPKVTKQYLDKSVRPTALRSLINDQIAVAELEVFADQILSARAWYRGYQPDETENFMQDLIYQTNHNLHEDFTIMDLLNLTVNKINQTIKEPRQ